jgi:hypothetical protein
MTPRMPPAGTEHVWSAAGCEREPAVEVGPGLLAPATGQATGRLGRPQSSSGFPGPPVCAPCLRYAPRSGGQLEGVVPSGRASRRRRVPAVIAQPDPGADRSDPDRRAARRTPRPQASRGGPDAEQPHHAAGDVGPRGPGSASVRRCPARRRFHRQDIRQIGQMSPELMGGGRGGRQTGTSDGQRTATVLARPEPSAQGISGWAQPSAHRPGPRTAARPR